VIRRVSGCSRLWRRGKHGSIRVRRALIIMASASGTTVPAIARLVAADEDTVRDVVHAFNEKGLAALDPQWAAGRPRLISDEDVEFIVTAATMRPEKLGLPFTHWSLRKLAAYLAANPSPAARAGRERLRQILHDHGISFQRTRTWKESADPVPPEYSIVGSASTLRPPRAARGMHIARPVDGHETGRSQVLRGDSGRKRGLGASGGWSDVIACVLAGQLLPAHEVGGQLWDRGDFTRSSTASSPSP
jgi:transposase